MESDAIIAVLAEADPVPNPERFAAMLDIQGRAPTAHGEPAGGGRVIGADREGDSRARLVAMLAGVAIVVLVVLGSVALRADGGSAPASPEDLGMAFIDARDTWDVDRSMEMMTRDVFISDGWIGTRGEYAQALAWYEATGWRFHGERCQEQTYTTENLYVCDYTFDNAWSRAIGLESFGGSFFTLKIEDDQISSVLNWYVYNDFGPLVWDVFTAWVAEVHPEGVAIIFSEGMDVPATTPDALDLWRQYTDEFVDSR